MLQPLLIEIGVEELPAIPLLKELPNIEEKWSAILERNALLGAFEFYYTPRRLVLWHNEFLTSQKDSVEELYGAPVAIAFKDGKPTAAAEGFAKKCQTDLDQIDTALKGGKEVLYFKKEVPGRPSIELLPDMIIEFIESLNFGKSMRWGSNSKSFIRPIRWLNIQLGAQTILMSYLSVSNKKETYLHRQTSFAPQVFDDIHKYFDLLKEGGVLLYEQERKSLILEQFKALEKAHQIHIEIDEDLLAEVVAITEHPVALLGNFSETFLELPNEVIVTSMREHQRYFPVLKDHQLSNHFIVVSNAITEDYSEIVKGNEKVLHARLSDALFFYHNDLKRGLSNEGLEKVVYMNGLGTLSEKLVRERNIAETLLLQHFNAFALASHSQTEMQEKLKRIFEISKADLMSEMVYEFTELQGIVGYYYADKQGEDDEVALAIKEQYLPDGEQSNLPSTPLTALVAISVKLDAIMGLFSINQIPTGSRDPFGLRRAATGIIKIALHHKLPIDIKALYETSKHLYQSIDYTLYENFFLDRLYPLYSFNRSIVKSAIESGERNLVELDKKITAVATLVDSSDFKELLALYNRVANITKDMDETKAVVIDEALFEIDAEKNLYTAFKEVTEQNYQSYAQELDALSMLSKPLANFFDNVMVNAEDSALKNNRKNLILSIYTQFKKIADLKEISL